MKKVIKVSMILRLYRQHNCAPRDLNPEAARGYPPHVLAMAGYSRV